METQLFHDRFAILTYDDARDILELRWLAETESMNDDNYTRWLERYAASAEQYHVPFALIDTREFHHHPIPRYNRAGVKKFAFLLPTGAAPKSEPLPEGPARFPTGYFDSREQIDRWFTS